MDDPRLFIVIFLYLTICALFERWGPFFSLLLGMGIISICVITSKKHENPVSD
jgi:hypothetical protein